jgi:Toastrack DUF4097
MPTFTTPGPVATTVQVAGAHVRVTASDRTDTVVLVEPIDKASRSDVRVANKTKVDFAGGRLTVKTTVSGDKNGSVAITIDLPTDSSLIAYLAHSDVQAHGSLGECELHMAKGRVQLDRINGLQANIAAGEVAIGHIAGRAHIEGSVVAMRISEAQGTVELSSSGGQTWIGHASADLDLNSGSGSFDIDRADGSVTAKTGNGAIQIGRLTRGQAELLNRSGNIAVGISDGTAAWVDANSTRGSVRNSVPSQEAVTLPTTRSRSAPARGTATSSFNAQQADPQRECQRHNLHGVAARHGVGAAARQPTTHQREATHHDQVDPLARAQRAVLPHVHPRDPRHSRAAGGHRHLPRPPGRPSDHPPAPARRRARHPQRRRPRWRRPADATTCRPPRSPARRARVLAGRDRDAVLHRAPRHRRRPSIAFGTGRPAGAGAGVAVHASLAGATVGSKCAQSLRRCDALPSAATEAG